MSFKLPSVVINAGQTASQTIRPATGRGIFNEAIAGRAPLPQAVARMVGAQISSNIHSRIPLPIPDLIGDLFGFNQNGSKANGDLGKMQGRNDPLLTTDWEATITVGDLMLPSEYIEDVQLPWPRIDSEPVFRSGARTYFPKFSDITAVTVRLYEDIRHVSSRFVHEWKQRVRNADGSYNLPSYYKGVVTLYPKDPTMKRTASFKLKGCFPTETDPIAYNSTGVERVIIGQTLSVDELEIEFYG